MTKDDQAKYILIIALLLALVVVCLKYKDKCRELDATHDNYQSVIRDLHNSMQYYEDSAEYHQRKAVKAEARADSLQAIKPRIKLIYNEKIIRDLSLPADSTVLLFKANTTGLDSIY